MSINKQKAFSSFTRLALVMLVYALHMVMFLGVVAANNQQGLSAVSAFHTTPANKPHNQHDPSSVESRAMFKYEDARQLPVIDHAPALIERIQLLIYAGCDAHIQLFPHALYPTSAGANKRYRLLQVFLI